MMTERAKEGLMPSRSATAEATVEVEVPAVMQMEPMAAKMKMKSTTLPKRPFTALSPTVYLQRAEKRSSLSFFT